MSTTSSRKEYTVPQPLFSVKPRQISLVLSSILLFCSFICQANAEKAITEEWIISADKIARYAQPNSIVARGNVILIKKEKQLLPPTNEEVRSVTWARLLEEKIEEKTDVGPPAATYQTTMTIKADWIVYDVELQSIKAKGNLRITSKEDQLFAKEGTLNLVKETGTFTDATVLHTENSLHLEGKKIEKTGVDTYRIDEGWVITCKLEKGETPPWSFSSSKTNIRRDGYAVLKNAKFKIKNVPVFYTPYLLVPVKNSRQSGFLFPEISSSKNSGLGLNLPFFLNISDSADATFYPEYLANRGLNAGAEFRYVLSDTDKGMLSANFLDDELSDPSETKYYNDTGYTHENNRRYWLRGKADHTFADWQTRLDLDIVSDEDYLREFDNGVTGFERTHNRYLETFGRAFQNKTETLRENSLKALRSWNGMSLQMTMLAINEADTTAGDTNTPLWKLPSIDYSGVIPLGETYFSLDWDTNYVNYWRQDGIGGHRLDLHPTLSSPVPLGPYLESRAEVGVRDTFYLVETYGEAEWTNGNSQNRLYPELETEVATTLQRDYRLSKGGDKTITHQLRPYLIYGYIPNIDQDSLPQLDDVDFVDNKNAITYGVDNYLNIFSGNERNWSSLSNYAELKIEQSYDFRDESSDQPFSDIFAELKWLPVAGTYIGYKAFYDVYTNTFNRHILEGRYSNSRGDYLNLDYSFINAGNIEQINATARIHLIDGWYVGGSLEHSLSQDQTVEARGTLTYQAPCWAVNFETRYTPEDTSYLLVFSLSNIGFPVGVNF